MTPTPPTDTLRRFIIFMITLAITAMVIALAIRFLGIIPGEGLAPPTNSCSFHRFAFWSWWTC